MKKRIPHSGGFTLIEIMLVMGIITVLLGSAIYLLTGNLEVAKIKRVDADLNAISTQLSTYQMLALLPPTTDQGLDALVHKPTKEPLPKRWQQLMKELPLDPWGHVYVYKNPGTHNTESYDLYSLGPDGIESDDDIGNWTTSHESEKR